jgi:hypothetical protein
MTARDEATILHLDIDAFFAAIEQLRDPRLAGKPVIVGAGVIASCSYEARRFGLKAGMSLSEAKRLCPHAVILDGHAQTYRCFAEKIFELCRQTRRGRVSSRRGLLRSHRHGATPWRPARGGARAEGRDPRDDGLGVTCGSGPIACSRS